MSFSFTVRGSVVLNMTKCQCGWPSSQTRTGVRITVQSWCWPSVQWILELELLLLQEAKRVWLSDYCLRRRFVSSWSFYDLLYFLISENALHLHRKHIFLIMAFHEMISGHFSQKWMLHVCEIHQSFCFANVPKRLITRESPALVFLNVTPITFANVPHWHHHHQQQTVEGSLWQKHIKVPQEKEKGNSPIRLKH